MDASLIGFLGAALAVLIGLLFLRQALRARQVRLRLDYDRDARPAGSAPVGVLGLAEWPDPASGPPPERRRPETNRCFPEGGIAPPAFLLCERRPGRMGPALALSISLHAAFAIAGPEGFMWISRALDEEQRLVVRFENSVRVPLILQIPEARRVVFARRSPTAPWRAAWPASRASSSARRLEEPRIPELVRQVELLPSPNLPSTVEGMNAPRPRRAYRTVSATTLLQPRQPAPRKEIVELPPFAAWTGKVTDLPSPHTVPGSPTPGMLAAAPPPKRPVLPFPSGLPVRAAPPDLEEPRLALPPPGVPVDSPPVGGSVPGSGVLTAGEPVSVISTSPTPLEPGQTVQIPAVTQVGGGLEEGRPGGAGAGTAGAAQTSSPAGGAGAVSPAVSGEAAIGGGAAVRGVSGAPGPSGSGGSGAVNGQAAGTGIGGTGAAGAGSGTGMGRGAPGDPSGGSRTGSPYVREVRLGGQLVKMEQWPDGTLVLIFPPDGNFDVVVVENAFPEALSDLAKRLSGRPVYTAYLDVGAGREWTLHYCVPGPGQEVQQNSMVVTLEDPPPLHAPYIQRAELPPAEKWASSRYQVFHGFITGQGKLERVTAVRAAARADSLLKPFSRWQFRPATRSKAAVGIEVLLVVPPLPVP